MRIPCLLLLAACASPPPPPPPAVPHDLTASEGGFFGSVLLSWQYEGAADSYSIEVSLEGGAWALLTTVPGTSAAVDVPSSTPELSHLSFRVRAARGTALSAYSNEAPFLLGLRTPGTVQVALLGREAVLVSWTEPSSADDSVTVERAQRDAIGLPAAFTLLTTVPPSTLQVLDSALPRDGASFTYRVRRHKGAVQSQPYDNSSPLVPLFLPSGFTGSPLAQGASLSWQNRSQSTTSILVQRSDGTPTGNATVATLAATGTAATDSGLLMGYYGYVLELHGVAVDGTQLTAQTDPIHVATLPGGPLTWQEETVTLPAGRIARSPQGQWFVAQGSAGATAQFDIVGPDGTTHALDTGASGFYGSPALLFDSAGHAHAAYAMSPDLTSGQTSLVHERFDGSAWQREVVYTGSVNFNLLQGQRFALAPGGAAHFLWQTGSAFTYATNESGSWALEDVSVPSGLGGAQLAVAPDGTAFLALAGSTQFVLRRKPVGGSWTEETLSGVRPFGEEAMVLLPSAADAVTLYYGSSSATWLLQQIGGTWGAAQKLFEGELSTLFGAAGGGRTALVAGFELYTPEHTRFALVPNAPSWIGFSGGKLHALIAEGFFDGGPTVRYAHYFEP